MPRVDWGYLIHPDELRSWILFHDANLIALNKPAHVLCHPSKHGPWSSLAGAAREFFALDKVHLPSRLDRETSGIVVIARHEKAASWVQQAMARREVQKVYHALLFGQLTEPIVASQPIGSDPHAEVVTRRVTVPTGGQPAVTRFEPVSVGQRITLVRAYPETGRRHQIRVHARAIGHPVVGDKVYAQDERLFLEFLASGWTQEMQQRLWLSRHALHCSQWRVWQDSRTEYVFSCPLPSDWLELLTENRISI